MDTRSKTNYKLKRTKTNLNYVRFTQLIDSYETGLIMSSGKRKREYVNQTAKVLYYDYIHEFYTIQFDDGVITVVEEEQILPIKLSGTIGKPIHNGGTIK